MKVRKKQTFTVTKFEAGMEDGAMHSGYHDKRLKYKILPSGEWRFICNDDDCYIVKSDNNGSLELLNKKQLEKYYEEI